VFEVEPKYVRTSAERGWHFFQHRGKSTFILPRRNAALGTPKRLMRLFQRAYTQAVCPWILRRSRRWLCLIVRITFCRYRFMRHGLEFYQSYTITQETRRCSWQRVNIGSWSCALLPLCIRLVGRLRDLETIRSVT
jgi:hypothetical protein